MKQKMVWKQGYILNGRYQIRSLLGTGGMSEVYLAKDLKEGTEVAVKRTSGREAELLLTLDHEGIVWAIEAFSVHGQNYLAEEFVEGTDLRSYVRKNGPFPVSEAFEIALQICDILQYLHERIPPIIYRDLKPQNLLLRKNGKVMLIDFGIAREYVAGSDYDSSSYGTPGYAAPEQFEGSRMQSDPRTDIYALGKLLCFLISGLEPKEQGRDLFKIIPDPKAAEIIGACMEKNPEDRFQSAKQAAFEMQGWLRGERSPETRPPEKKKAKKAPLNPAALSLTLLGILVYAGGFLIGLGRAFFDYSETVFRSWFGAGLIWGIAFAAGTIVMGLGQIVRLLQEIKFQLSETDRK